MLERLSVIDIDQNLAEIRRRLGEVLKNEFEIEFDETKIKIEKPRDRAHGDWATNLALIVAKEVGISPMQVAEKIVNSELINKFKEEGLFEELSAAAPGFINIKLSKNHFKNLVSKILSETDAYGSLQIGEGKKVMIEFGQPNTHKAIHVGHLKSAISGLGLVRLYQSVGFEVIQANFYADVGMHVAKGTWGYLYNGTPEGFEEFDHNEKMKFIDSCYVYGSKMFKEDPEIEAEIRYINKQIYSKTPGSIYDTFIKIRDYSIEHQTAVWASLGIKFDREYPESEVVEDAMKIVKENISLFKQDAGAIIFDADGKPGLNNWVFITKENLPTYEAKDLALAKLKFDEYNPDLSIITTSIEQSARFKAIIYCLEQIDEQFKDRYVHIPFGWMLRGGKKFSSRMGESVKGMDILLEVEQNSKKKVDEMLNYDEAQKADIASKVAQAGLKFLILSHEFHKDFSYDPEQFLNFEGFSGPYCLYAYARAKSILRKVEAELSLKVEQIDISTIDFSKVENDAFELLRLLADLPFETFAAFQNTSPHILANYAYTISQAFNSFYAKNPVLSCEDKNEQTLRILITAAFAVTIKNTLTRMGIETIEQM